MKLPKLPILALLSCLVFLCESTATHGAGVNLSIDWPQFMARLDPIWDRMPADYFEGPFVGNGLLGAILFKDDQQPNTLRFEIGRTDVYDHRGLRMLDKGRLPIGQLLFTPEGAIKKVNLRTDLWNAEIRGVITTDKGTVDLRCFVPGGEEFMVIKLRCSEGEKEAKSAFRPEQGDHPRHVVQPGRDKGVDYEPNPPLVVEEQEGIEVVTQPLLVGDDYATAWSQQSRPDGSRTILLSVANRWAKELKPAKDSAKDAVATLKAAWQRNLATVEQAHRAWWHHYYQASFVSVPDSRLESFYWIQLYKLASATRPGLAPIDLMGPWFKKSVWAAYWYNLNVQLTYFTTGITNHLDLAEPLYSLMDRCADDLVQNVPPAYRDDCAGLSTLVGFGTLKAPIGLDDKPESKRQLIALPWMAQLYYDHVRMAADDTRLRQRVFPLMKRAFQVYARSGKVAKDGRFHLFNAFSDEYGYAEDTSVNLALARWGFTALADTAERLKLEEPLLPQWREMLSNLADYPTDKTGIMIGKETPFAKPHRHFSHLFAIFPLHTLNLEQNPDQLELIKTSLQHFTTLDGDNCMFKFTGAASLWAAVGDGDTALQWLQRAVAPQPRKEPTITPNTLYSEHGWPTFESPISAQRAMLDMLLQSWGGLIRVFPACPSSWPEAAFHDLRAEGGFLVSASRQDGHTQWVRIKSLAGEPCRVWVEGEIRELKLARGQETVIKIGESAEAPKIAPRPVPEAEANAWGVRDEEGN